MEKSKDKGFNRAVIESAILAELLIERLEIIEGRREWDIGTKVDVESLNDKLVSISEAVIMPCEEEAQKVFWSMMAQVKNILNNCLEV